MNKHSKIIQRISGVCLGIMLFCSIPDVVSADRGINVVLKNQTLKSGYTVFNQSRTMEVGIRPNGVRNTKSLRVHIRQGQKKRYPIKNETLLSDIHIYQLKSQDKFKLNKKVWLKLSYPSIYRSKEKVIKYWDQSKGKWRALKTKDDQNLFQVSAALKHKNAVLGVFEKKAKAKTTGGVVAGLASWYDGYGAACNDFPINSRIRITNTGTGKSVDSTIVSTGPFIPGRVVDLTRDEFAAIADLSAGVVNVSVQQIK